jgi:hypothetical protein
MNIWTNTKIILMAISSFLISCGSQIILDKEFALENPSSVDQNSAVIGIPVESLGDLTPIDDLNNILVSESDGTLLISQWIDNNQDGSMYELLVQVSLKAGEKKDVRVYWEENGNKKQPEASAQTYARFVPERIDDFAWENDKVAFRTFGPVAQQLAEANQPGGTLTSGIDLWLKKVDYSIIDKWYAENLKDQGYYHKDHGEGYDPYHVGSSRGAGGIGVWMGDTLLTSKNFIAYRTIANGPLRTVFELDYAPWSEFGIRETKRISLDLGSNFSRFQSVFSTDSEVPNYAIGITLHKGQGDVIIDSDKRYFGHWEEIDGAYVGEGIVVDAELVEEAFAYRTSIKDQSQLFVKTRGSQQVLEYYGGFAWTKSGQISNKKDWEQMLNNQAALMSNPVRVGIKDME